MHNIIDVQSSVAAGATNVIQRGYKTLKSGRRPKRNARYALKLIESTQSSAIQRYQRIGAYEGFNSTFDGAGALSCDHRQITIARTIGGAPFSETANAYPVHLFDLTSGNFYTPGSPSGSGVQFSVGRYVFAPCQWRLIAYQSGTPSGTAGDFYWYPETGQNAVGGTIDASAHWNTERNNASVVTNTSAGVASERVYPFFSDKCIYNWADIRMALYGAKTQTTKFTVSLVQITDRAYDPTNQSTDRADPSAPTVPINLDSKFYTGQRSRQEQANFNAAMHELVQPLIFHPMHSAGATKIKVFKTLMKRTFNIGPDTSVNEDDGQPNVLVKFFKNLNRVVNYAWNDTPTITNDLVLDSPTFNQYTVTQVKGFAHPRAKLYLMVTAQAFTETGGDSGRIPSADVTPGFDMVIRRKVTYDYVSRPAQTTAPVIAPP